MFAAFKPNLHLCLKMTPIPHLGGIVEPDPDANVFIGSTALAAAKADDPADCPLAPADPNGILSGSGTVLINNKQAARWLDPMKHGGFILLFWPNVFIGDSAQAVALTSDKAFGDICDDG